MDDQMLRRKLIKGSLSAPLILTIGKAGASARTTFAACFSRNDLGPTPAQAVPEADEVFRVTRDVYEFFRAGTMEKLDGRYVWGWDNQTLYRLEGSRLVQVVDNTPGFAVQLSGPPSSGQSSSVLASSGVEGRRTGSIQLLAYLDDNGNVVGLAPQSNGGSWTMRSCYASLAVVPRERGWDVNRLFG